MVEKFFKEWWPEHQQFFIQLYHPLKLYCLRFYHFAALTSQICWERDIFSLAQALSYTTVLSLVPILMIFFFVLGRITENGEMLGRITQYISSYLLPDFIASLVGMLQSLSTQATKLGIIGFPSLLVVGVFLFIKVDSSINRLWLSIGRRGIFSNFSAFIYSSIIGPVLIVAVLSLPTYLKFVYALHALESQSTLINWVVNNFLDAGAPFLITFLLVTAIYYYIPTEKVRLRSALLGAFWISLILRGLNSGVEYYLKNFSKYDLLYGSISILPVLMLWLYILWLLILFGSVLVYAHQTTAHRDFAWLGKNTTQDSSFHIGMQLMLYLTSCYKKRQQAPGFLDLGHICGVDKLRLNALIHPLLKRGLIRYTTAKSNSFRERYDRLALACDPSQIKVNELKDLLYTAQLNPKLEESLRVFILKTNFHPIFNQSGITLADLYQISQNKGESIISSHTLALEKDLVTMEWRGLQIYLTIGAYDWERTLKQPLVIDLRLTLALSLGNDELKNTLDYSQLEKRLAAHLEKQEFKLLETALEAVWVFLQSEPPVRAAWVRIAKPRMGIKTAKVSVEKEWVKN